MPLKLSDPVVKGLQHLGTEISLDIAKKLIGNTLKHILSSESSKYFFTQAIPQMAKLINASSAQGVPSVPDIYATNADKAKLSEYAVVTILSLAIKHSCDPSEFRAIMEKYDIQPIVLEELARIYEEHRRELTLHQLHIGSDFPHITDVQWRIMADVRSSTSDCSSGEVSFHVNLGRFHETTGDRETVVEFVCSTEEMQSLINKLKEIERHCEKVASE